MIYFNKKESISQIINLEKHLKLLSSELDKIKNGEYQKGNHQLNDYVAFNYFSYLTQTAVERSWEAHKHHIDVHVVLEGNEIVEIADCNSLASLDYNEVEDSIFMEGEKDQQLVVQPDQWLFLFPNEAHKTGVVWQEPKEVTKVVFKIKVEE